jgi:HK97 gp10 family phage protein
MAMFKMTITGLDYLQKKFQTAPKTVDKKLASKISKYTNSITRSARALAPVDTGALRESIRSYNLKNPTGSLIVAGNPTRYNLKGNRINYAGYQEFGVGKGFHIPQFNNISRNSVFNYAYDFRNRKTAKKTNVPYRSYMFTSLDRFYDKMIRDIGTIEI